MYLLDSAADTVDRPLRCLLGDLDAGPEYKRIRRLPQREVAVVFEPLEEKGLHLLRHALVLIPASSQPSVVSLVPRSRSIDPLPRGLLWDVEGGREDVSLVVVPRSFQRALLIHDCEAFS